MENTKFERVNVPRSSFGLWRKFYNILYALFWILGLYLTLSAVKNNFLRYSQHDSTISRREYASEEDTRSLPFPIIITCSNNMHSSDKIKKYYPMIDENATLFLYGRFHQGQPPINIENKTLVEQLDKIDLRKFFMNTRPSYTIKKCFFGRFNCKRNFHLVGTLAGVCLQLDPNHHTGFSSHDVLTLSLKIKPDSTPTGWAPSHGFTFYMTTLGEEDVLLAAHGTYADGRTIPLVLMQNEERRYLGKPFTPCADGYVNVSRGKQYDNLRVRSHDEIDIPLYKEYDCLQKFMAFRVFQECNCYPDYIDSIYNWMSELGLNNLIG